MASPDTMPQEAQANAIRRHRTAIRRVDHSLPIKCLLRDGLANETTTILDYGCGHGVDVRLLRERGFQCKGWDPAFCPDEPLSDSDVVNLGYVINVIEAPQERSTTLQRAWGFCRKVLCVAAQIVVQGRGTAAVPFGDGIVTRIGTFQKYFTQEELRSYIEAELGEEPIAVAPGIFFVFRDESLKQDWLSRRYRRRAAVPSKPISEKRFEEHRQILEPLMAAFCSLGRLPEADELACSAEIEQQFGSIRRAFSLVRRVTGESEWEKITADRKQDLLIYLALGRFRKRPPLSSLPVPLQRDLRAFFGSYTAACKEADELLFRAGDAEAVSAACAESSVGKLLPDALYVHRTAVEFLPPLLRVYEGCAKLYLGEVADATIVKLHRHSGKVSYLAYPDFDDDPHPSLKRGVKVALRSREIICYDYNNSENPPVLHRKEVFVHPDYSLYQKFARLTEQEERHGLLAESSSIGTLSGWTARLHEYGFTLRGHRLVKRPPGS